MKINTNNGLFYWGQTLCTRELAESYNGYKILLRDGEAVIIPSFNMKNAKAIYIRLGLT